MNEAFVVSLTCTFRLRLNKLRAMSKIQGLLARSQKLTAILKYKGVTQQAMP